MNDAPVCNAVSITTNEDTLGQVAASCTDVDGNPLTYSTGLAVHGTSSVLSSMLRYTPQANYFGADIFTYKANDGNLDSNSPSVSVTVNPVNDAPVIAESDPQTVSISENGAPVAFALTLNASDIECRHANLEYLLACRAWHCGGIRNWVIQSDHLHSEHQLQRN